MMFTLSSLLVFQVIKNERKKNLSYFKGKSVLWHNTCDSEYVGFPPQAILHFSVDNNRGSYGSLMTRPTEYSRAESASLPSLPFPPPPASRHHTSDTNRKQWIPGKISEVSLVHKMCLSCGVFIYKWIDWADTCEHQLCDPFNLADSSL